MKQDENNTQLTADAGSVPSATCSDECETHVEPQPSTLDDIIDSMNLSSGMAATTKAILEPLKNGESPSKSVVELIVKALTHDEDVKNADAAGYLRGRNETIEAATKACDDKEPQPVNFPVYRKRSFWDK